ncbi:MAG: hypothetical protein O2912_10075 [Proteobacteria bacterium]|nr:hypothetical protein [Pseudomonadota bacterium]
MTEESNSSMMIFSVPNDPKVLSSIAKVTLRHSQLEYVLRMTIKSITGIEIQQALDATSREGAASLRKRILRLAKKKIGDGKEYLLMQALLKRCQRVSERRNDLTHNVWGAEIDGDHKIRSENHEWIPIPTAENLEALAQEIFHLMNELNKARFDGGFLHTALSTKKAGG